MDSISPRLDDVEARLTPGHGGLDLGLVADSKHIGVGLSIEHRIMHPDLSMFVEAQARYNRIFGTMGGQVSAGLRWTW